MPNATFHGAIGAAAGPLAVVATTEERRLGFLVAELIGSTIGGYAGGRAPDLLEPAHNPHHRHVFHSVGVNALLVTKVPEYVSAGAEWLRTKAAELEIEAAATADPVLAFILGLGVYALRAIAGFLVGFAAGWASHVALDSATPMGLPLLVADGPNFRLPR